MVNMGVVTCPFCGELYSCFADIEKKSYREYYYNQNNGTGNQYFFNINCCGEWGEIIKPISDVYKIVISQCPNCKQDKITIEHYSNNGKVQQMVSDSEIIRNIRPKFQGISFPDYVPLQIRQDYEEASTILKLSPKASATLSRRCLQGMIRDHFGVVRGRLNDEIIAIHERKLISEDVWNALNALRDLGNIGAHMEKDVNLIIDVDEEEAEKLVHLIEYLIKMWYIEENNHALLIKGITDIAKGKKALKHSGSGNAPTENRTLTNNAPIKGDCNMNAGNITINNNEPKGNRNS